MGNINSLFTTNPSEILPVEAYLSDLSCDSIENLGSTRFMKVAKGKNSDGVFVYKVYVRQDATKDKEPPPLDPYPQRMMEIRRLLGRSPNCCTVKRVLVRPKYVVLLRWYQKHTLFDRLSTRPFVVYPEKMWYIFQLFKALEQCEAAGVCHGDLKTQNILISSSNWLQITDFAPFKPSFLPQDNPSSFTYFFDTSRRQSCYLAPERMLLSDEYQHSFEHKKEDWLFGSLQPSMDIFSAGCIVYELLCDGRPPFTYSQLCEYRSMSNGEAAAFLEKLLQDVPSKFWPLLKLLLNREPGLRLSAKGVLSGAAFAFPSVLETFLFRYLNSFRPLFGSKEDSTNDLSQPLECSYIEPDDVLAKLKRERNIWWREVSQNEESRPFAILLVSLITSNMRSLRTIQARIDAMNLLVELASLCEPSVSTDRVLPYLVYMLSEPEPHVRAAAIFAASDLLAPIQPSTYEESKIFVDYLFPEIAALVNEDNTQVQNVQLAIALSLGSFADTAYKFMMAGKDIRAGLDDDEVSVAEVLPEATLQSEQSALIRTVKEILMALFTKDYIVRRCVVNTESFVKLCDFFKRTGSGYNVVDVLTTFLNAKADWQLRAAFFDSLPLCLQRESVGMHTLIHQGLQDFEEMVVVRAIGCAHALVLNETLDKPSVMELLPDIVPFLVHPNEWIRSTVCDFLVSLDDRWSLADIHVKLLPLIRPFLSPEVRFIKINSKLVLMDLLVDCIPRDFWSRLMAMSQEETLKLLALIENHLERGMRFESSEQWFHRLVLKMEPNDEEKSVTFTLQSRLQLLKLIYSFKNLLPKMAEWRSTAGLETVLTRQMGLVDLSSKVHDRVRKKKFVYGLQSAETDSQVVINPAMNPEWCEIFGDEADQDLRSFTNQNGTMKSSFFESQVHAMLAHFNDYHVRNVPSRNSTSQTRSEYTKTIKGILQSHLHEHAGKITKLAKTAEGDHFASSSVDGTIKIWGKRTVSGEGYDAIRSDESWNVSKDKSIPVRSVGWAGQFVLAALDDGRLCWADASTGIKELTTMKIPDVEGPAVELHSFGPVSFIRTHHGTIYALDIRVGRTNGPLGRHEVWRKKLDDDKGLVTCSAVDPWQQSWMVLGTSNNQLILWDLRFQEEVLRWKTPRDLMPVNVWPNTSSHQAAPEVYVAFECEGDVSLFDLSTQPIRKKVFWSGTLDPLVYKKNSYEETATALQVRALCVCESSQLVYTGDTRGTLRRWDPTRAAHCKTLSASPRGRAMYDSIYMEKQAKQMEPAVIYEKIVYNESNEYQRIVPLESRTSAYHRTSITDVMLLNESLISASTDGVIKIWK